MNLDRGAVVEVIQKNLEGWWKIRYHPYLFLFPSTAAGAVQSRGTMRVGCSVRRRVFGRAEYQKSLLSIPKTTAS